MTRASTVRQRVRVEDDPRIGFLRADVARFCDALDDALAPAHRLRLISQLQSALAAATEPALVAAMRAAVEEGWGLRRIGVAVGLSHEKVRYLLAAAPPEEGIAEPES